MAVLGGIMPFVVVRKDIAGRASMAILLNTYFLAGVHK